jgi:arylsulfatase A-like enzyme
VRVKAFAVVLWSLLVVACGEAPPTQRVAVLYAPGAMAPPHVAVTARTIIEDEIHPAAQLLPWTIRSGTGSRVVGADGQSALDVPLPVDLRSARWVGVAIERSPGTLDPVQIAFVAPDAESVRVPYPFEDPAAPKTYIHPVPDLTEIDFTSGPIPIPTGAELTLHEAISPWLGTQAAALAFTVTAVEEGRETQIHHAVLDTSHRVEDRKWVAQRADLSALAGRTVRFRFAARLADGQPGASLPVWGDPVVLAPRPRPPLVDIVRARMRRLLARASSLVGSGRSTFPGSNVLVIAIDTLRADHLGCYGYPRPTSPRIDALAAESVVFSTAISQSPWTLPSFASILTGLLPSVHRAGEGQGFTRTSLDTRLTTLGTELHRAGWRTGSFVSNSFAGESVGLAEGCETIYESSDSESAVREATAFLRTNARERFFAFVHLIDPHHPYEPPVEDAALFLDPTYRGRVGVHFGPAMSVPLDFTAADRQRVIDLYDGEIHASDRLVGELVDLLRELDVLEQTIVVVVSDHGEELFDHGLNGHGHTLYDELLHVPLLIRFPDGASARRVDAQVRTMDLFPTILDALGLPVPPNLQGMSRMPLVRGGAAPPGGEAAFSEFLFFPPEQKAVRRDGLKLIYVPLTNETKAFDIASDRREQVNVAQQRSADVDSLRTVLEREVLRRVEGFQIVARSGSEEHQVRIRMESSQPFGDVGLVGAEDGERPVSSNEGRMVEVRFHLPARDWVSGYEKTLHFQLEGDERFAVQAEVDGRALDPTEFLIGALTMQAEGPPPWTFGAEEERLIVPFPPDIPPSAAGSARIALYRVRRPPPPVAALDDKTREKLRQLGYIP